MRTSIKVLNLFPTKSWRLSLLKGEHYD